MNISISTYIISYSKNITYQSTKTDTMPTIHVGKRHDIRKKSENQLGIPRKTHGYWAKRFKTQCDYWALPTTSSKVLVATKW